MTNEFFGQAPFSLYSRLGSAVLLGLALAELPYGFYTFLRWVVTLVAVLHAYHAYLGHHSVWTLMFAVLAILFNPIAPVYLDRDTWKLIDVIAAALLLVSLPTLRVPQQEPGDDR